jgi:ATP-dependent DNA helicase RecQ
VPFTTNTDGHPEGRPTRSDVGSDAGLTRPDLVRRTAAERFGYGDLRPGQLEAVEALLDGDDVLVVMPTGAGKSAVYQLAALLLDGPTVVVSPLIALQHDQMAGLGGAEGAEAVAVNSAQSGADTDSAWQAMTGGAEFVFLAPEQLAKDEVVERLAALRPSLLVIDEAHCISSWGHDFRPDYLRVGDVRARIGDPVVVALTATASPPVRAEIIERLRMSPPLEVVRGFDRPNLWLSVQRFSDDAAKRQALVDVVRRQPMPGLVYVGTRADTERYAETLAAQGLRAAAYHAGLRAGLRHEVHEQFLAGDLDVVVATSAFGMGIDKPNVRFVVHAHISESLDAYYQEIGRGGRDGGPADATLLYREQDLGLRRFLGGGGPDADVLAAVAAVLHTGPVSTSELVKGLSLSRPKVLNAVNLLELASCLAVSGRGRLRWVDADVDVAAGVERAAAVADERRRIDRSRLEMMRAYAETNGCRRQLLLGYFGEVLDQPCGHCDTCESAQAVATATGGAEPFPVNAKVHHAEWGPGVVMHPQGDRITVLFEREGYKTLALQALEDTDLLRLDDTA